MVNVLLDTRVVSELRRVQPDPRVVARVDGFESEELFASVVTLGELWKGVALLALSCRKIELARWVDEFESSFSGRILPVVEEVARTWGEITARSERQGMQIPPADGLIAATAIHHGMQLMTRNARHFEATGATVIDPWNE